MRRSWLIWLLAVLAGPLLMALVVGTLVERQAWDSFGSDVRDDALLRRALLDSEIARFRLLPVALADDQAVVAALGGGEREHRALSAKLEALAARSGAAAIYVIGADGHAVSASNWRSAQSFVGQDYRQRRYFSEARERGEATQFAVGTVSHQPGLYIARRTGGGGVIVVKLEFDAVEAAWARSGGTTFVTDADGIVLITSRPEWRFATLAPVSAEDAARFRAQAQAGEALLSPLPIVRDGDAGRARIADDPALLRAEDLPPGDLGWSLHLLMPSTEAVGKSVDYARIGAALAALALLAMAWGLWQRGRRRAGRVALVQARAAELETAVDQRTAELRREMDERAASEARAAELRDTLRQANRLATLGQVTASVAHETAQPVAAIRTYAANGETLLDRGETEAVRDNLKRIVQLTERIGMVTTALRGFARKGAREAGPVPLAEVIDGAVLILRDRLRQLDLVMPAVPPDLTVFGGKVRLEQVLVNLLQNASEALDGRPDPRITMTVAQDAEAVRLRVADNGPGVAADVAARIFTPFVTSRASGLGLGLVIAQDIMADFGGALRLVPTDAGACFEVELRRI